MGARDFQFVGEGERVVGYAQPGVACRVGDLGGAAGAVGAGAGAGVVAAELAGGDQVEPVDPLRGRAQDVECLLVGVGERGGLGGELRGVALAGAAGDLGQDRGAADDALTLLTAEPC